MTRTVKITHHFMWQLSMGKKKWHALALIKDFDCDVNVRGFLSRSLLHSACAGGNVSLVETLIREHKADINDKDSENNTPLHVAAFNGKKEVVLALIKN